jgi:hypothetical protein
LNLYWAGHPKSPLRAQQPRRPSNPTGHNSPATKPFTLARLFHCWAGPTRQSPAEGQPSRIAQGARDGTTAPARRPARRGIGRAHARVEPGPGGKTPFTLTPHTPVTSPAQRRARRRLGRPGGPSRGSKGISPCRCGAGVQKRGGSQRASRPSHQPHWGFPFPLHLRGRCERVEKEAPPLRRAEEGRGHTGTPTTCQGRSAPPRRAGRGRGRELGAGARTGAAGDVRRREHLHRRERLHRPEHRRHATDDPKPATTTPPPNREHRPATLLSSAPWSSSYVLAPRTSRRVAVNLLPGCWPSSRRTVVPRRMGLLGRSCS